MSHPVVPAVPRHPPVVLAGPGRPEPGAALAALAEAVAAVPPDDVAGALALSRAHADVFPLPGSGQTRMLWQSLATVGAVDLTAARVLEPHLDAQAILAQAGGPAQEPRWEEGTWGVYAAEGPGARLEAADDGSGRARLNGSKPWCSLAGSLTHALVTAWCSPTERRLYAAPLGHAGVVAQQGGWVSHGLRAVPSGPVSFTDVPAVPVGAAGWYLERPGFAWGGIGVAAIWLGGAVGLARRLHAQAARRELDQIGQAHLGAVDVALHSARSVLSAAAADVDAGHADGADGAVLALRVRRIVASAAETVLTHVDHALGPAPLALEQEHARRVSDLRVYIRQEHAERDLAALGRALSPSSQGQFIVDTPVTGVTFL